MIRKVEDVPVLAALAYACHSLLSERPWMQFTEPQRFESTIKDGFARVDVWPCEEDEPLTWDDSHEDLDDYDGTLISTVEDR